MKPKVLFVDDEVKALTSYRRILENEFDLELESNPEQAFERVKEGERFQVVVSDLRMPKMDGLELFRKIREIAPDTVRILLTGYASFESAVSAVNQGNVFRFLSKPCSKEDLAKALRDGVEQFALIKSQRELHTLVRLQKLMDGVVIGLSTLVEKRDPYTAGHQRRVAQLACAIAARMGFGDEQLEALRVAALLHDIGKVYVPSDFLNKPGRLNKEEFAVIKLHPEVGADILKYVDSDWPISEVVLQHHERLDGSGYPSGLQGEDVILEARIICVADVVDAMSSMRPYRASLGQEAALEELRKNAGIFYDQRVVAICLDLFEKQGWQFDEQNSMPL